MMLGFIITINKFQEQPLGRLCVFLPEPYFVLGQLHIDPAPQSEMKMSKSLVAGDANQKERLEDNRVFTKVVG